MSDALRERQQSALECSMTAMVDDTGVESHTSGVSGVPVCSFSIYLLHIEHIEHLAHLAGKESFHFIEHISGVHVLGCSSLHEQGVMSCSLVPEGVVTE